MKTLFILLSVFILGVTTAKAQSSFNTLFKGPKPTVEATKTAAAKPVNADLLTMERLFQNYRPAKAKSAVATQVGKTTGVKMASDAAPVTEPKPAPKAVVVPTQGAEPTKQ